MDEWGIIKAMSKFYTPTARSVIHVGLDTIKFLGSNPDQYIRQLILIHHNQLLNHFYAPNWYQSRLKDREKRHWVHSTENQANKKGKWRGTSEYKKIIIINVASGCVLFLFLFLFCVFDGILEVD